MLPRLGSVTLALLLAGRAAAAPDEPRPAPPAVTAGPLSADLLDRLAAAARAAEQRSQTADEVQLLEAEELDSSGKVKHAQKTVLRVTRPGGKRSVDVLLAQEDGKDSKSIREEVQRAAAQDAGEGSRRLGGPTQDPFSTELRASYRFTVAGQEAGLWRVAVEPLQADEKLLRGEFWVDPARGEVVRAAVRPGKAQSFVEQAEFQLRYEPGQRLAEVSSQFTGGFWIFKKRARTRARFLEGAEAEAAAAQARREAGVK